MFKKVSHLLVEVSSEFLARVKKFFKEFRSVPFLLLERRQHARESRESSKSFNLYYVRNFKQGKNEPLYFVSVKVTKQRQQLRTWVATTTARQGLFKTPASEQAHVGVT